MRQRKHKPCCDILEHLTVKNVRKDNNKFYLYDFQLLASDGFLMASYYLLGLSWIILN